MNHLNNHSMQDSKLPSHTIINTNLVFNVNNVEVIVKRLVISNLFSNMIAVPEALANFIKDK